MHLITKTASLFSNKVKSVSFRNLAKALNQEIINTPSNPNQETLTDRILLYLNPDKEKPNQAKPETLTSLRQNAEQKLNTKLLQKLNTHEIINISNSLTVEKMPKRVLKELDAEYCTRLRDLSTADILRLLNIYMVVVPNRITEYKFYKNSIRVLFDSRHSLDKKDLLQLIFYIGLRKKHSQTQFMLRDCMKIMDNNFINSLTVEELCIICNSSFKTSTKILNTLILEKVRTYIGDNLSILSDCALFVTMLKTLRHNRQQNEDLLATISCATIFNKTFAAYPFSMMCHIMALYADYFYYDAKLFEIFINKCLHELENSSFVSKDTYLTKQLRGKDIKRFLWILSMFSELKLVDKSDLKNVILPKLMERIQAKEFSNDFDSLIDIALYLWIINYRPYDLVPYIFNNAQLLAVGPKTNLRLNLLIHCIYTEDSNLSKQLKLQPVFVPPNQFSRYQLQKRPHVQRVLNTLNAIKNDLSFDRFDLSQEVPHLNIIGITGYKKMDKVVYIELLDDYTRVKNVEDDVPVGLMALKLRLLDQTEEGLLTISLRDIEDMTEAELREFLFDEVKLIC